MKPTLPPKGVGRPDPVAYGRSLESGIGVNLLVSDISNSVQFLLQVLAVQTRYWDDDFALCEGHGGSFMLHHDRTYRNHAFRASIVDNSMPRGVGVELRLYGCDPDQAVIAASQFDAIVLADAQNKPHGVREAYIIGPEGYVWVPTIPLLDQDDA